MKNLLKKRGKVDDKSKEAHLRNNTSMNTSSFQGDHSKLIRQNGVTNNI